MKWVFQLDYISPYSLSTVFVKGMAGYLTSAQHYTLDNSLA
jgi:hypothetical protein